MGLGEAKDKGWSWGAHLCVGLGSFLPSVNPLCQGNHAERPEANACGPWDSRSDLEMWVGLLEERGCGGGLGARLWGLESQLHYSIAGWP